MPNAGDRFGDFVLRREIGRGAAGTVWEAHQESLDRTVALKILSAQTGDSTWVARFKTEAGQASRLSHSGILPVYAIGETEGLHWFAMELVKGRDLAHALNNDGPLDLQEAARCIRDAALALHHAHEHGVVHRDVKPANIMVREDGRVVVADFGLAKHVSSGALTTTGLLVGTPYYMSPEAVRGERDEIGAPTDVYGLGATLYELVTGNPPFLAENSVALIKKIAEEQPPPPSKHNANVPRDLETIILAALAKRPERRYANAMELANDLTHFIAGEPISRRPSGVMEKVGRFARRNRTAVAVAAVALIALAGAIAFFQGEMEQKEQELAQKDKELEALEDKLGDLIDDGRFDQVEQEVQKVAATGGVSKEKVQEVLERSRVNVLERFKKLLSPPKKAAGAEVPQTWASSAPCKVTLEPTPKDAHIRIVTLSRNGGYQDLDGASDSVELAPGLYCITAQADGHHRAIVGALVPPGAEVTLPVELPALSERTRGMQYYGGFWGADPSNEGPSELVRWVDPYYLDEAPVAVGEYQTFLSELSADMEAGVASLDEMRPSMLMLEGATEQLDAIVAGINKDQATTFARRASKRVPSRTEVVTAGLLNAALEAIPQPQRTVSGNEAKALLRAEITRSKAFRVPTWVADERGTLELQLPKQPRLGPRRTKTGRPIRRGAGGAAAKSRKAAEKDAVLRLALDP